MKTENGITTDNSQFVKESRNMTTFATLTIHPNYKEIVWRMEESGHLGINSEIVASGVTDKSQTEYILAKTIGNGPVEINIAEEIYSMFI